MRKKIEKEKENNLEKLEFQQEKRMDNKMNNNMKNEKKG